jgi:hypothetical protein
MVPRKVSRLLAPFLLIAWAAAAAAAGPAKAPPGGKASAPAPPPPAAEKADYPVLAKPGSRIALPGGYTFVYGFDSTPKMGVHVMKVQIFSPTGEKDTSFEVTGDSDMPSMRGVHASGMHPFRLSRKGDYLMPVNVVMPGDWEVRFTFRKGGKVVLRGCHLFDV